MHHLTWGNTVVPAVDTCALESPRSFNLTYKKSFNDGKGLYKTWTVQTFMAPLVQRGVVLTVSKSTGLCKIKVWSFNLKYFLLCKY